VPLKTMSPFTEMGTILAGVAQILDLEILNLVYRFSYLNVVKKKKKKKKERKKRNKEKKENKEEKINLWILFV
jgi:hypothetical protein